LRFAGSNPAKAVCFKGDINPQQALLWKGSKAVGPMSFDFTAYKNHFKDTSNYVHNFLCQVPSDLLLDDY
jgi:hypothetical protein